MVNEKGTVGVSFKRSLDDCGLTLMTALPLLFFFTDAYIQEIFHDFSRLWEKEKL